MKPVLSERGARLARPAPPFLQATFKCATDSYDAKTNPQGYINFGRAENKLSFELIRNRMYLRENVDGVYSGYDDLRGSEHLRRTIARFMEDLITDGSPVSPDELSVGAGAGSVLETLANSICDPGDGVIVSAPYYPGFDNDLCTRAGAICVPAFCKPEEEFRLTPAVLDETLAKARSRGIRIRALLLCSPNNPLGSVYSREELRSFLDWTLANDVPHLISDEIYAKSVFGSTPFVSMISVIRDHERREELHDRVHMVYATSKDFCASGFRIGILWSKSQQLHASIFGQLYFCLPSTQTQHLMANIFADLPFVKSFIDANTSALRHAYTTVSDALQAAGIPSLGAGAGFFVWMDLRGWLSEPTFSGELSLWQHILDIAKVNLVPGEACHCIEPGFFRLCYAAFPDVRTCVVGIERLAAALTQRN